MDKNVKKCYECKRTKTVDNFYQVNGRKVFKDGYLYICNDCVRNYGETINKDIVKLFWLADVPMIKSVWAMAVKSKNHTLIEYLKKMKLKKNENLRYADSDTEIAINKTIKFDLTNEYLVQGEIKEPKNLEDIFNSDSGEDFLLDKNGNKIVITTEIRKKWLSKDKTFEDFELLDLEKYVTDMKLDYSIEDTSSINLLDELAFLSVKKTRALANNAIADYSNLDRSYQTKLKDAGFRPIDKKSGSEKTGVDSLGQIVAQIEKENGFIAPKRINFPPDDIDRMLTWYKKWVQRFNNEEISTDIDSTWRDEVDESEIQFTVDASANEDEIEEVGEENVIE